jgi:hypothetical protein
VDSRKAIMETNAINVPALAADKKCALAIKKIFATGLLVFKKPLSAWFWQLLSLSWLVFEIFKAKYVKSLNAFLFSYTIKNSLFVTLV